MSRDPQTAGECDHGDIVTLLRDGVELEVMLMRHYRYGGWAVAPVEVALRGRPEDYFHVEDDEPIRGRRVLERVAVAAAVTDPLLQGSCAAPQLFNTERRTP